MRNLERFRQSSILSKNPSALFPPKPSFEVQSSDSKPLFPIVSQSTSSVFGTGNANKPQTGTTGSFGRAFAAATAGHMAKEFSKETVAEEKIHGLDTSNLTALVIKNIPDAYNKNAWLKRFYSRFGEVTKVLCSAAKNSASVVFKTHVSKVVLVTDSSFTVGTLEL